MFFLAALGLVVVFATGTTLWMLQPASTLPPDPIRVEPAPLPEPDPVPVVEPEPADTDTDLPEDTDIADVVEPAVAPTRRTGTFSAKGVRTAWMKVGKSRYSAGEPVPVGKWPLQATFDDVPTPVNAGKFEIRSGSKTKLVCKAKYQRCAEVE